jgi:hypothetical protein
MTTKLARTLLAGTCLTGAAGMAAAGTVTESVAVGDFSNSSLGSLLPTKTTQVLGTLTYGTDEDDWFQFNNLTPSSSFFIGLVDEGNYIDWQVVDSSFNSFGAGTGTTFSVNGTVPGDGKVIVHLNYNEGNPYTINFEGSYGSGSVPEPGTLGTAGLALGGALAWRRRRKQ